MTEGLDAANVTQTNVDGMNFQQLLSLHTLSRFLSDVSQAILQAILYTISLMAPVSQRAVEAAEVRYYKLLHECSKHKTLLWVAAIVALLVSVAMVCLRRRQQSDFEVLDFNPDEVFDEKTYRSSSPSTMSSHLEDLPPPLRSVYQHEFRFDQNSGGYQRLKIHHTSPWRRRSFSIPEDNSIVSDQVEYFKGDRYADVEDGELPKEQIWRRRTLEFVS